MAEMNHDCAVYYSNANESSVEMDHIKHAQWQHWVGVWALP